MARANNAGQMRRAAPRTTTLEAAAVDPAGQDAAVDRGANTLGTHCGRRAKAQSSAELLPANAVRTLQRVDRMLELAHLGSDHPARLAISESLRGQKTEAQLALPILLGAPLPPTIEVGLVLMDEQVDYLPDLLAARYLAQRPQDLNVSLSELVPAGMPLPKKGDVLYLSSTSAWAVSLVVHEWLLGGRRRVLFYIEHVGASRTSRPESCRVDH